MNKKHHAFWKEKSFYVSLVTGGIAMAAVVAVCLNVFSDDTLEEVVPYQTVTPDLLAKDGGPALVNPEIESSDVQNEVNLLEQDITEPMPSAEPSEEPSEEATMEPSASPTASVSPSPKTREASVSTNAAPEMNFDAEKGLLWPVSGDVILKYSMDKSIYFQTLGQYKCNPGVAIRAKEGTEVLSAADAVVTEISENEELGKLVKTSIGDSYTLLYGQLTDIQVKKGDQLKEGEVIGVVAKPTKYYSIEGSNLYFQINQKDETVNPMLLLR